MKIKEIEFHVKSTYVHTEEIIIPLTSFNYHLSINVHACIWKCPNTKLYQSPYHHCNTLMCAF